MATEVTVEFSFKANVVVQEDDPERAAQLVRESFGCVGPTYHAADERITGWDASVHPDRQITALALRPVH